MVCLWVVPACLLQVRKDHWKGMSAEQLAAIKHQQESQLEAKRAADAAAAAVEAAAIAESRNIQRAVLLQAQAAELVRRQQAAAVAAAQRDQVAAKATKDAQTNQLYANKVCLCEHVRVCWAAAKDTCMPHVCPLPLPCGSSTSISCLGCVPGYRAALWPSQHHWLYTYTCPLKHARRCCPPGCPYLRSLTPTLHSLAPATAEKCVGQAWDSLAARALQLWRSGASRSVLGTAAGGGPGLAAGRCSLARGDAVVKALAGGSVCVENSGSAATPQCGLRVERFSLLSEPEIATQNCPHKH